VTLHYEFGQNYEWDLGWDLGRMGYGILPSQLIWVASINQIIL